ncbi:unnamed protein product [Chondrus crispus]|uniref:GATA-type domain-containing protein n=1 Tax=Chondrus crispus TaxID=2769 RepID=R7Q2G8_CHOCR|nr:unnamed protein product [Chondrus crispus]CDF32244.1 unnamed protein product [Chondrus crispus]|eukprot:XP_005711909.1 unnamed protein product [Chondrus crispus]
MPKCFHRFTIFDRYDSDNERSSALKVPHISTSNPYQQPPSPSTGPFRQHTHRTTSSAMSGADSSYSRDVVMHSQRGAPLRNQDLRLRKQPAEPMHPDHNVALVDSRRLASAQHRAGATQKGGRSSGSRKCNNCGVSQTRQWVRGEDQVWLCHSCGQFWRKNGYSRPEELWNRPMFRRSSRKRRVNTPSQDQEKKSKPAKGAREASSSYMNGKKMVECGERLPPIQKSKNSSPDSRYDPVNDHSSANLRLDGGHRLHTSRKTGGGAPISNMIHVEPMLPPVSQLLKKNSAPKERRQ